MKNFLRLCVSIITIFIVIASVLFLLDRKQKGNNRVEDPFISSGDKSGEGQNETSFQEEKAKNIKQIEERNLKDTSIKTVHDSVDLSIMGKQNEDYFTSFEVEEVSVMVQLSGSMIAIIPAPDFLNNAYYHYDQNGNLVLYVCELIGVGGQMRYYFDQGKLFHKEETVEEDISLSWEEEAEILQRATMVYQKYIGSGDTRKVIE